MANALLTLNAGSSSLKFALFHLDGDGLAPGCHGEVSGIGGAPHFLVHEPSGKVLSDEQWPQNETPFDALLTAVLDWIDAHLGADRLVAVGHRVVHGGPDHGRPELVTAALLAALDDLAPLAPLHERQNVAAITAITGARPKLPQVACFDTAFHLGMPVLATRFALPREYAAAGIRRYGFHGLSYEYVSRRLRDIAPALAKGRVIVAHLGNGASLCAIQNGRSIDTTMGLTPLDGLMMGTRCGALDPGVVLYLQQQKNLTVGDVERLLYLHSGLLGVSGGIGSDMKLLLASRDSRAAEAVDLFVYRIARDIGALTSSLDGLDGIVFTAGIGEHCPEIREKVCARLGWLGVRLEAEANLSDAPVISTAESRVEIRVLPTDEEAMIARHTLDLVRPGALPR